MRLSWNEMRAGGWVRSRVGGRDYEKGETQSFYDEFFEIFGPRGIRSFDPVTRLGMQGECALLTTRPCR